MSELKKNLICFAFVIVSLLFVLLGAPAISHVANLTENAKYILAIAIIFILFVAETIFVILTLNSKQNN